MRRPILLLFLLLFASPAIAATTGDDLVISVLTFGPGEEAFFKFGHNAIWVQDRATHRNLVYNFGTFGFDTATLIPDFLKARFKYWLSVQGINETIAGYRYDNRSVDTQVLNLTAAQKLALANALAVNAEPENMFYKYDYYLDNCSTRVRDAVDQVLGGRTHDYFRQPGAMTFRQHTDRCVASTWWEYLGLNFLMNDFIDQPIDRWAEMFLPEKVQQGLRDIPGLVTTERRLVDSDREGIRSEPPRPAWMGLLVGLGCAAGLLALGRVARTSQGWRRVLGSLIGLCAVLFGFLGSLLVLLWTTDHYVAHHNENILLCAPWLLATPFFLRSYVRRQARGIWAKRLIGTSAGAALLDLMLKPIPAFDQVNFLFIGFFLCLWIGAYLAMLLSDSQLGRELHSESKQS